MGDDGAPATTTQTQTSKTEPWSKAQPLLMDLIKKYGNLDTGVTSGQSDSMNNLVGAASNLPNFGESATGAVNKGFNFSTAPQIGMLQTGFEDLNNRLGSMANGDMLDPYATPGFGDTLNRITGDITNKVKSQYAAAGRDPSGAGSFAGSLGKGLAEGIAPVVQSQYNQNVSNMTNAAKSLYDAAGSTATGVTGQQAAENAAGIGAIGASGAATDAFLNPATKEVAANTASYNLPWSNLAQLLGPATQLGGMGGSSSGTTTGVQTPAGSSMASNILGGITGGAALMPMLFGSGAGSLGSLGLLGMLSDENAKDDIEPVGELYDGQKVYRYRYKGDPVHRIGLLAQEVAETNPDAVMDTGIGYLGVDYRAATDGAAELAEAA